MGWDSTPDDDASARAQTLEECLAPDDDASTRAQTLEECLAEPMMRTSQEVEEVGVIAKMTGTETRDRPQLRHR